MFAKLKRLLSPHNRKLPAQQAALLVAVVIFLIGMVSSIFLASMIARQAVDDFKVSLQQKNNAVQAQFNNTMGRYSQLLKAGATLFGLKGTVSRGDWAKFYNSMGVERTLPGTLGVGYVKYLKPDEIQAFTQSVKDEGYADFSVQPAYSRKEYTSILYLEPFDGINQKAFGYDMMSEPLRNAAMSMARDNAEVTMTAPVTLIQDTGTATEKAGKSGVMLYYPVYRSADIPTSVEERRNQLDGFTYVVVRPGDVLDGYLTLFPDVKNRTTLRMVDTTDGSNEVIAEAVNATGAAQNLQVVSDKVSVMNRTWTIDTEGRPSLLGSAVTPALIITFGTLISFAVAATMLRTLLRRIERVEHTYAAEVERTKDELLALASHQLRTPASGVKQYIGILTSGIVGELTPAQQQIAEKAYVTNERQIEIINQLLYVSKIEAGKITIHPTKSDITPVVQRIVDQHAPNAQRKNIKLVFRMKRPHYIYGDDQYYPMIIDNLISNAIKYSYPKTSVTIKLSHRSDMIALDVTDTGVGIADADKVNLFKKFNRIENELSRTEGGSGLGLFLAYQLARAHEGDIEVKSTAGKGSTFTLLMPMKPSVEEATVDIVDYSGAILPR